MSASTSSSSSMLYQEFVGDFYSRRLLLHTPLYNSPATTASPPAAAAAATVDGDNTFDANVVMVLSVLLCALICSLGLNSIIRCALRCSTFIASQSGDSPISARLATTGIKKKALKTFPTLTYSVGMNLPGLDTECVICLSEFTAGERLRILPKCNHGFHLRCIDKWLGSHSSCPTCRHCLIETFQKIVGCSSQVASASEPSPPPPSSPPPLPPPQENIVVSIITPLEPEGLIRNYRGVN